MLDPALPPGAASCSPARYFRTSPTRHLTQLGPSLIGLHKRPSFTSRQTLVRLRPLSVTRSLAERSAALGRWSKPASLNLVCVMFAPSSFGPRNCWSLRIEYYALSLFFITFAAYYWELCITFLLVQHLIFIDFFCHTIKLRQLSSHGSSCQNMTSKKLRSRVNFCQLHGKHTVPKPPSWACAPPRGLFDDMPPRTDS